MSAWMCSDAHISALLTFAIEHGAQYPSPDSGRPVTITAENATAIGQILVLENVRSLMARYGDDSHMHDFAFQPFSHVLTPVEALKAVACLDYQSCEDAGWEASLARKILDGIDAAILRMTNRASLQDMRKACDAEWQAAPWGIDDDSFTAEQAAKRKARA